MQPLSACGAFIFDMDGTLTVPQHDFDAIRAALDIPQGALILEHLATLPTAEAMQKREQLDALELGIAKESQPAPGLFNVLDALRDRSIPCAILTRNSARNAVTSLAAIGADRYFGKDLIVGRDEATPKPHPSRCAMVGDYRHDLQAGRNAGCHTVHVRHGDATTWPELTDTTINSLEHLLAELS